MIARPILFSGAMVKALIAGSKWQTRRIVKPQPDGEPRGLSEWSANLAAACGDGSPDPAALTVHSDRLKGRIFPFASAGGGLYSPTCPYGRPGDLLWVRETHYVWSAGYRDGSGRRVDYRATEPDAPCTWTPSIHMPRWASRLTLRINDVRVERLQEISEADAEAEGTQEPTLVPIIGACWSERDAYAKLWERINGKGSWARNEWVWVVSFEVEKRNVDDVLREAA